MPEIGSLFGSLHRPIFGLGGAELLSFGYDAMQNRVLKSFTSGEATTKTYYIRDVQGNIMATYQLASNILKLIELPLYGSARLGELRPNLTMPTSGQSPPSINTNFFG